MTKRITKTWLNDLVKTVNEQHGTKFHLNYASFYGGYCLEDESGMARFCERKSAKEMYQYLVGMIQLQDAIRWSQRDKTKLS